MAIGMPRPAAPDPMTEMKRKLAELEGLVARLMNAPSLENATVGQGGIRIINGGTVKVIDTDGHTVAIIGALPPSLNRSDGSPQPGLMFYREDGTLAAFLGDANPLTPPYKQAFQVYDRTGRTVLADDTNSGHGLANPHIDSGGMENTNTSTWPATNATSFTSIASKYMEFQNPYLTWQIQMFSDAGITSQFKVLVNGVQVSTTQTVSPNSFAFWSTAVALPAGVNIGDTWLVELQAKVSATTGSARAVCYRMSGAQSP